MDGDELDHAEPYVRLSTLRTLHRIIADVNAARSLAGTLQAVVEGAVTGLGFDAAAVSLVRPDGDLVVSAVWELTEQGGPGEGINSLLGRIGSRESWERLLGVGDTWGSLIFVPHERAWAIAPDLPVWGGGGGEVPEGWWHPEDALLAPMRSLGGELLGVLSVDRPRNGRRPGPWLREALEMFAQQCGIAIGNARLRAEMQRTLIRLEREQQTLLASEESYRQAFEFAPSGMALTELHGEQAGRLTRVNDALCRLLGRSRASLQAQTFADLVHPEDARELRKIATGNGRAEVRLARRDNGWLWVHLRNSVISDATEGAQFLLTHVEDIEDRKRHELQLAHRASHDALTGLPNAAELRARLSLRLCEHPHQLPVRAGSPDHGYDLSAFEDGYRAPSHGSDHEHVHTALPDASRSGRGLAVIFCDLDGFKGINDRHGHNAGDAVLIEVAQRLQQVVREGDTVARLGGDEFVVLADGVDREQAKELAARLKTAISPPIRWENRTLRVGVSLGIGWAGCGMTINEVLHTADELMYVEKRARSAPGGRSHRRAG
ncbi:diguanylate cyclase domain-containing protein [Streptacidiphilus monticola]|uniref:Diguanylate cyclase domain-containing protein n=1 Tax=Streptacidiphilus monticola TaxID=2161674 RepID=A0ABW1G5R0_9ACTN